MSNFKAKGAVRTIKNYTTGLRRRLTVNNDHLTDSTPTYEHPKL
ncbi:4037_t:CDS:2 [Entrophospora sp. SA101]|nr:4037_t:CDS:2 [Entrophospora sp. SA101]